MTASECMRHLLAGLVTSADTGNEELVIASRAALADFCEESPNNTEQICTALVANLQQYQGQDRVVVPTLEVVAYLFHIGLLQQWEGLNLRQLCLQVQKAAYKTGNVRKLEAAIKVYGGIAAVDNEKTSAKPIPGGGQISLKTSEQFAMLEPMRKRQDGANEAKKRLGALLSHPWPRVKSMVVDELWKLGIEQADDNGQPGDKLLGIDWAKAEKKAIALVVTDLGLDRK
jgi:hypothetical protein